MYGEADVLTHSCVVQVEVKEARNMMVEANTQEYAFNFLQQSLKNRIQDAEVHEVTASFQTERLDK